MTKMAFSRFWELLNFYLSEMGEYEAYHADARHLYEIFGASPYEAAKHETFVRHN
jgi:hypothetical protein